MTSKSDQKVYNEICDKIVIAKHLIPRIQRSPPEYNTNQLVLTICYYTGVDRKIIEKLVKDMKPTKTFRDVLQMKNNKTETSVISFEQLRKVLIFEYVMKQRIPTKASIVKAVKAIDQTNIGYTPSILKQDMNHHGFIWKRLPKSDKFIVVENTEQFSNRMKYLQQMMEYRENNRVLIHVERTLTIFSNIHTAEIILVASPQLGLIDTCFPPKLKTLEFFLRNKLHTIPPNSVFVIEQSNPSGVDLERTCKLPTIHSKKNDMIKWLEAYDIPCDSALHRGELYALIEKHKVNCPPYYRCCEILKAAGHDVILRPPELTYTKYFKGILSTIVNMSNITLSMFITHVVNEINSVPQNYWLEKDQKMAEAEQKIFCEDLKLELTLDTLMEGIKNKSLSVADCETEEIDSDFVENVIIGPYSNAPIPGQFNPGPSGSFNLGPSGSIKQGPFGSPESWSSGLPKPGLSGLPKPGPSGLPIPGPSGLPKSGPSGSNKPGPPTSPKPGPSGLTKPGPSGLNKPGPLQAQPGH